MNFSGKVTIVTGGALGIGGGISRKFSEKGSKIVIADIDLEASLENSAKIRIRNRCEVSGRPHGVYRKLKISRIALRDMASAGKIPGITKSSW